MFIKTALSSMQTHWSSIFLLPILWSKLSKGCVGDIYWQDL